MDEDDWLAAIRGAPGSPASGGPTGCSARVPGPASCSPPLPTSVAAGVASAREGNGWSRYMPACTSPPSAVAA